MAELVKSVFAGEFPLTAQFREGPRNPVKDYATWKGKQFMPEGFPVDLQTNVLRFAPENYDYANRFAEENPSMLIMSTWRAASGNPKGKDAEANGDPLGESVIEFPGHFVLSPGSYLKSGISASATTLQVADGSKMVKGPALLVETDNNGNKLWEFFEYVLIKNVNGNTITVKREFNGSPEARAFPGSKTYVAPMPYDFRVHAEYTDWFFNYSEFCPLDSLGRTAMDVILEEMIGPLDAGGALDNIGGLDLASGPLNVYPINADYDVDGVADNDSVYRDGVRNFYERVWNVLGSDRVLTSELDYDMLGFINGLNQEGLARPNDPWKEVSRTVNEALAWERLSDLPMVSLAFVQYLNSEEEQKRVQLHRLLNGYASCLGFAADVDAGDGLEALERDELFKGADKEAHWLGKRVGSLVRPAALSPNLLLNYTGTSSKDFDAMLPKLDILRADLFIDGGELVISPNGEGSGFVKFTLNFDLPKLTDFTVLMEARSDDMTLVRHIKLPTISGSYETGGVRATISNVTYVPVGYLVRRAGAGAVEFSVRFEDGGDIRIRNLSVHAATDTLACQFERGVVLVNPSLDDVTLNLQDVFPGRTGYRRLTASNVPSNLIPSNRMDQYNQAKTMNNGKKIGNPSSVTISERNALFLIAAPNGPTLEPSSAPTNFPTVTGSPTAVVTPSPTACLDDEEKFELHKDTFVGCWYVTAFASKTERRCAESSYNGKIVREFCKKSCGDCDLPSPTPAPNGPSPPPNTPTVCKDKEDKFELREGTFVGCWYVTAFASKTERRCAEISYNGKVVSEFCPESCDTCDAPSPTPSPMACEDDAEKFELNKDTFVGCWYVTKFPSKTERRCAESSYNGKIVKEFCPKSCGDCDLPSSTAAPTGPTQAPSDAPSLRPTVTSTPTTVVTPSPTACKDDEEKFELRQDTFVGCWYVTTFPSKMERRCEEPSYNGRIVWEFCPKSCGYCN